MTLYEITIPNIEDCLYLLPISDLHIGSQGFNQEKLAGYLDWVKEHPNSRFILLGDMFNCVTKGSVRNVYDEKMHLPESRKLFYEIFTPFKKFCLGWIDGNHEEAVYRETGDFVGEVVCDRLGWQYYGIDAYVKLRFGKRENNRKPVVYTLYATHGWGAGRKTGTALDKVEELRLICLADIYLASHHHKITVSQNICFIPDLRNNKLVETKLTYVAAGTFKENGRWEGSKGFKPVKLGSPRIRLDAVRKDVHVSI